MLAQNEMRRCKQPQFASAQGFTLIELMMALTIGLLITAAVLATLLTGATNRRANDRTTDLQASGRYALQVMKHDLQHAGFRGQTWIKDDEQITRAAVSIANDCTAGLVTNVLQPVWAANDSNPFGSTCISSGQYARGDVLVVRRAANASIDVTSGSAAQALHIRSAYTLAAIFKGSTLPAGVAFGGIAGQDYQDYRIETSVYYVGTCTTSPRSTGLCRVRLIGDGAGLRMQPELIASDIENMQVRFSQAQFDTSQIQYKDASGIAGAVTDVVETDWNRVSSVRLWLLAKAASADLGPAISRTYDLGDASVSVNDSFRRQVFSVVVNLRNNWSE